MIQATDLQKSYGRTRALNGVSFEIREGECAALIGPNGSGKSTLLRILSTLSLPDRGSASIAGYDVVSQPGKIRRLLGYLPDDYGLYRDLTVAEFMTFFAIAYGVGRDERARRVSELLDLTGLTGVAARRCGELSSGIQQRVCLAKTLVQQPRALLLDEPCSALDPAERVGVLELLKELRRMGITMILISHILGDLHGLCDRILILETGRIVAQGRLGEMLERYGCRGRLTLKLAGPCDGAERILGNQPFVWNVHIQGDEIEVQFNGSKREVAEMVLALTAAAIPVKEVTHHEADLETLFLRATEGQVQ